jgi:hypothetical protein
MKKRTFLRTQRRRPVPLCEAKSSLDLCYRHRHRVLTSATGAVPCACVQPAVRLHLPHHPIVILATCSQYTIRPGSRALQPIVDSEKIASLDFCSVCCWIVKQGHVAPVFPFGRPHLRTMGPTRRRQPIPARGRATPTATRQYESDVP